MERPREDKIVIDAQLIETFRKIALENKPACFVDYDEGKDDPIPLRAGTRVVGFRKGEHT